MASPRGTSFAYTAARARRKESNQIMPLPRAR
eukprot:CAMPEP_0116978550 /NCGR_PEP_ID=MMETSP0467-20121206/57855_1 /TAXON_ID=283647 /ORGANISM="Mesodinium pulex, Strain SPMC105" /LENGTH=31 /DNA_ID= /DNA_START= /DNA_END= /DNA_ORIENTATION=